MNFNAKSLSTFEKSVRDKEEQCKKDGYLYFGWSNNWDEVPVKAQMCSLVGHMHSRGKGDFFEIQGSPSGSLNIHGCDKCKYYYFLDSSD